MTLPLQITWVLSPLSHVQNVGSEVMSTCVGRVGLGVGTQGQEEKSNIWKMQFGLHHLQHMCYLCDFTGLCHNNVYNIRIQEPVIQLFQ